MNQQNLKVYKASAGSGKTHSLTGEYLKLAFLRTDKFSHILAVTFTNKAAEEMKSRIIEELQNTVKLGNKAAHFQTIKEVYPDNTDKEIQDKSLAILNQILHNYTQFTVSTIDSFVQKVVRSFSFELGVQSGYKIEMDQAKVLSDLLKMMYKKIDSMPQLLNWLITFAKYKIDEGKSWDFNNDLKGLANEIFKERFQLLATDLEKKADILKEIWTLYNELQKIKQHFKEKIQKIAQKAEKSVKRAGVNPNENGRNLKTIYNYLTNKIVNSTKKADFEPNKTVAAAYESVDNWHAKSAKKEVIDNVKMVYPTLLQCLYEVQNIVENEFVKFRTAIAVIQNFHSFGIIHEISSLLPTYRDSNNLLLINDTTQLLKNLIGENEAPFIYEKIGNNFHHILIDEFQDTSGFQWDNFKPLISNSLAYGYQNLIVGDIKQSIYRWRGGDWKLLLSQVKNDIGTYQVQELSLDSNWRSRKNIIDFNNTIFKLSPEIIQNFYNSELQNISDNDIKNELYEANFQNIITEAYSDSFQKIPRTKNGGRSLIHFFEQEKGMTKSDWRNFVHENIPEIIEDLLLNKNYNPRDITILVRSNRDGQTIVNTLLNYMNQNDERLRYRIISSESLFIGNSGIVKLLLNALHYINDDTKQLYLSALVFEYFKIQNKEINHNVFDTQNTEQLKAFLPQKFWESFIVLKKLSIYELCEKIINIFELSDKNEHFVYLQAFLDVILEFSRDKSTDLYEFLEWWDETGYRKSVQLSDAENAVRIMTIHKSKGLAFQVVLIPYCDWDLDHNHIITNILWAKTNHEPFNSFSYLPIQYSSQLADTYFAKDYFEEKLYAFIDALNILYVAFTRAVQELIVFACYKPEQTANVGDVLYQCVKSKNIPENCGLLNLEVKYESDEKTITIDENYTGNTASKKQENDDLILPQFTNYPNYNWQKRLSIVFHSTNFFQKSIKYIEDRINYGKMMHNVLSKIATENDIESSLKNLYFEGQITYNQLEELQEKITTIIKRPTVKDWFSDKWRVVTEKAILTSAGKIKIPDRILINNEEVIIIDFKFGEEHEEYHEQIKNYMNLLKDMNYENISGYLYYADKNKIEKVS